MFRKRHPTSSVQLRAILALAVISLSLLVVARAAMPLSEATVTRLENKVSYGQLRGDRSELRPAAVQDVIKAENFLQTETDSRAELKYNDGSIVRVGQNTIFSFEAASRTLSLRKGSFIFYVPKGSGGTTIKTPSLTAAITGTIGKVSPNTIAILEGAIKLMPSGLIVAAGQFARFEPDGTIKIDFFDPAKSLDGKLIGFNGPLPGLNERIFMQNQLLGLPDFSALDSFYRTQNLPNGLQLFNPAPPINREDTTIFVPPPSNTPPSNPGVTPPY